MLSRLPALEDGGAYGALAALPGHPHLKERLLAKQLAALDELIMQLQGYLGDMQVGSCKDSRGLQACARWQSGGVQLGAGAALSAAAAQCSSGRSGGLPFSSSLRAAGLSCVLSWLLD